MVKIGALFEKYPRLIALIAGGVSATGFAPLNLWPLTLICLALLMHLVASADTGKRALLIGWLFGVGHFSIGNNWIATAFTYQAAMPAWLGWIAVVALALYLAVYPALAALTAWWIGRRVSRGAGTTTLPLILAFAGCWIITEWLRSWVFTGFAWNPLSATILEAAFNAYRPVQLIGTYGLSGVAIFISGCLALAVGSVAKRDWRTALFASFIGFVPHAILLLILFTQFLLEPKDDPNIVLEIPTIEATIVQPNISQIDKHTAGYEAVSFSRLAQQSRSKDNQPHLLLWPESAVPWWLEDGYSANAYWNQPGGTAAGTRAALSSLLGPDDLLLTGADRLEFGSTGSVAGARNSVLAIDAKGSIRGHYDKAHLVPYGEYLALRWLLEPLGAARLVPGTIDFWPGPGPQTMRLPFNGRTIKVGTQICYEIIFSGQVVDRANRPDFIFNPSNDAWFGSWGPPQHLAQARLRAIEEGLPVVRSTPTGISAVIDADGRIVESLPLRKAGRIDTFLPEAKAPTLFARYGNILPVSFAALLIALAFLPLARRRLSR